MKITIANPNVKIALGFPATVTFDVTPNNLRAFNLSQGSTIKNAPSFNENVNKERGLPTPEARQWLRELHGHVFGIMHGNLTMRDVKKALE
jgi:hypothetical protein